MLLPLFDSRLLSYRLPRSLLLTACLLNTFVAAPPSKRELAPRDVREPVKYDLQLMKWKATGHDGAEVETTCLYFGNWNKLCSPYTLSADIRLKPNIFPVSFLPDTSWNQIGGSRISLGEAQFASESYRDHILQVTRLPPYTGIPLEDIHNFMIYLSTSFSATETKFVVTADTMEKWKQTLIEESSIKFEVKEYVYESSYHKSGDIIFYVGTNFFDFRVKESADTVTPSPLVEVRRTFPGHLCFRNDTVMKDVLSQIDKISRSKSDLPLPNWFIELVSQKGYQLDMKNLPNWIHPWLRFDGVMESLRTTNSGWIFDTDTVKVLSSNTLESWKSMRIIRLSALIRQKKTSSKPPRPSHKVMKPATKTGRGGGRSGGSSGRAPKTIQ
ncbi:hypothetical protein EV361DRAFT_950643 [Lentinula raphanica]|uniref:Uncharacterized protein n=1 Tax=Lentinula raphanica TaxID=153919 RepID=A0AA38NYI3_9AGAR|nr:hypothetical protein F5878DRAFT_666187 [Lentinula raphanica]KAJ3970362.1 hypothetical protein EV361DRAFT_950643 [Lentinula raphanica]